MLLAPSWALFGGALDAKNIPSPHLAPGIHLRVLPSPAIGLPSTPLFVSRFEVFADSISSFARRNDIRWTDASGNVLTAPFDLPTDPTTPVTGWLPGPPSGTCIWISVNGHFNIGFEGGAEVASTPPISVEAWVSGPQGPSLVGTSSNLFVLAAPRIDYVVVRGQPGSFFTVDSVSWIAAEEVPLSRFVPWRVWSLPTAAAPRYQPTATAQADANSRVSEGASPHQPLFVNPVEGGPTASPAQTPADETARIGTLSAVLAPMVNRLVNDLSQPPPLLSDTHTFDDPSLQGTAGIPLLGHVLQASVDPGVARWLGFADVDKQPPDVTASSSSSSSTGSPPGSLVLYLVRGLWPERSDLPEQKLLSSSLVKPGTALSASFPELASLGGLPSSPSRFFDLGIILAAPLGEAPDLPSSPVTEDVTDEGWRPDLIVPDALRTIDFSVSGLLPMSAIAFAAKDGGATTSRPLNPALGPQGIVLPDEPGYASALPLPLAATVDDTNPNPGSGGFSDRDCPEQGGDYRIAQADLFGRWSEWTHIGVASRPRTPPPAPSLDLHYDAPTLSAGDTAPEAGTFTVSIPVPPVKDLPAGGRLLVDLALDMSVDGVHVSGATFPLPAQAGTFGQVTLSPAPGADSPGLLIITFTGPALTPAASAAVTFVGTWGDGTQRSGPGGASRTIFDPRPVPPPLLPTDLIYAQRPDTRGNARLELPFPAGSPLVRVYFTTETTVLKGLALLQAAGGQTGADATTAINEITAATQGSARAQAFGKWKALYDYTMFENLTEAPFSPTDNGLFFPHVLSSSLTNLALYRVLSVAPSGVLSDFATSPLVAAMVPNFGAPPRPFVTVSPQDPADGQGVVLTVKVSGGTIAPFAFRVRRATQPYSDPRSMLVVNTGGLAALGSPASSWLATVPKTDSQGATMFTLIDPGPFARWRRYFWSVEVQAAPPPGAPTTGFVPPGEWSLPSSPVQQNFVPPDPPGAPDSVTAQRNGNDVVVTITATGTAAPVGTPLGLFRVEVFRTVPGARPLAVAGAVANVSATQMTITDTNVPANASYAARVVDPLGRRGALTTSSTPV
jgi:hypothetical protein